MVRASWTRTILPVSAEKMANEDQRKAAGCWSGVGHYSSVGQSSPREALTENTWTWCLLSGHGVTQFRLAEDPHARWIWFV